MRVLGSITLNIYCLDFVRRQARRTERKNMETSKNPKSLIIGLDLGVDTTQISVSADGGEPESVSISPNKSMFLIPTVLCVRYDTRDWIVGDDAIRCRNREAGFFVNGILETRSTFWERTIRATSFLRGLYVKYLPH